MAGPACCTPELRRRCWESGDRCCSQCKPCHWGALPANSAQASAYGRLRLQGGSRAHMAIRKQHEIWRRTATTCDELCLTGSVHVFHRLEGNQGPCCRICSASLHHHGHQPWNSDWQIQQLMEMPAPALRGLLMTCAPSFAPSPGRKQKPSMAQVEPGKSQMLLLCTRKG